MSKHTPTPWVTDKPDGSNGWVNVRGAEGESVATCWTDEADENAEFIVRACNAHDELVELVKYVIENGSCYPSAIEMTGPVGCDFEEWGERATALITSLEGGK